MLFLWINQNEHSCQTALNAWHGKVPVCITGRALAAGSPVPVTHWAYGIVLGSLSTPHTVTQTPAAGSDLLLLLKPWHSVPLQPDPDGLTLHLMGVLGSQDTDVKGIWKRSNHQKKMMLT